MAPVTLPLDLAYATTPLIYHVSCSNTKKSSNKVTTYPKVCFLSASFSTKQTCLLSIDNLFPENVNFPWNQTTNRSLTVPPKPWNYLRLRRPWPVPIDSSRCWGRLLSEGGPAGSLEGGERSAFPGDIRRRDPGPVYRGTQRNYPASPPLRAPSSAPVSRRCTEPAGLTSWRTDVFPRLADRPDSETRDTPETHRDTAQTRRMENETRESLENTCREERTGGTKGRGRQNEFDNRRKWNMNGRYRN